MVAEADAQVGAAGVITAGFVFVLGSTAQFLLVLALRVSDGKLLMAWLFCTCKAVLHMTNVTKR